MCGRHYIEHIILDHLSSAARNTPSAEFVDALVSIFKAIGCNDLFGLDSKYKTD